METPLTPLAFAARARRIYADRDATVFEGVRRTYAEFLDRIDRWSQRLQELGVKQGDRVAYIAQNTPTNLEGYYAAPQIGAVLVPINYRLAASDFVYILNHCGAKVLCVDKDYVEAIEAIRAELPQIEHFVALESRARGLARLRGRDRDRLRPFRARRNPRERPADHQLHQRHDGAAERRDDHASQRLSQRDGHARAFPCHARRPLSVDAADVPRQRLDLHMARDRPGMRACLPAQGRSGRDLQARRRGRRDDALRRADGPHRHRQRAGSRARARRRAKGQASDRRRPARRPHHRPHRARARLGGAARLRHDRDLAAHPAVRAAARARKALAGRARGGEGAPGRRAGELRRDPRDRTKAARKRRATAGRSARSACAATSS